MPKNSDRASGCGTDEGWSGPFLAAKKKLPG